MDPLNILAKFEVCSFTRFWDNRNTLKFFEVPGYANAPFPQIFKGLLFAWTLWIYVPNLNFVALRVPEIIVGGSAKIWAVPGYAHAPFSPKF